MPPAVAYEMAGPTMLALQPPSLPSLFERGNPEWDVLYAHLQSRYGMLRQWRLSWWAHWARLAEFILPYRYRWLVTANTMNRGSPVNDNIVDETATLAMQICAHGLLSGLMSGSWFKLDIADPDIEPDAEARAWLEDTEERIYDVLAGSNWYTTMAQGFRDVATFGTAPIIINEDHEQVVRCYLPCAGEYYLAKGGRLSVDTLIREFTYTVNQSVDFFGLKACPAELRQHWMQAGASLEREYVLLQAIEPNFALSARGRPPGRDRVVPLPGGFAWREAYWLKGNKTAQPLSLRGYHEKPFFVLGWSSTSNDAYYRGPGMDALGGTAQLQHEQKRKGEFIDKGVRPPMGADPELQNKPTSILPGQITFVSTAGQKKGFWPLYEPNPAFMAPLTDDIKQVQARIDRCFFTDTFLAISQMEGVQPRNELELRERIGEKVQMLGPVVQLFETEALPDAMQRIVAIMQRRRMIKPPPKSLLGRPLNVKIEYRATLKLLLRAGETASIERGLQIATKLDETAIEAKQAGLDLPLPGRIIKLDQTLRHYLDRIAFPMKTVRSEEEVAAMDDAEAQKKRLQQTAEAAQAAIAAGEGASKIDVGGGRNAVQALLGTGPQPGPGAAP